MHFDSLHIQNFGPISELRLQLASRGINTIFGRNASGKTQIVGAIQFALLGEMCDVYYHPTDATATPSIVEIVLVDGKHRETIRCKVDLHNSVENNLAVRLNRTIDYALTYSNASTLPDVKPVMLHRRLMSLLENRGAPTLIAPYEHSPELDLHQFRFDSLDVSTIEDESLRTFIMDLKDLARSSETRLPSILSEGQRNLLALLQEFSTRRSFSYPIPFILDSNLGIFGGNALQIATTILQLIAERDQVVVLSSSSESFSLFDSEEIKTRYDLPQPDYSGRHISLVSYAYYGESPEDQESQEVQALIVTEGKTDWKHLKAALRKLQADGMYRALRIEFQEYEDDTPMGSPELKKLCEQYSKLANDRKTICVFDRDEPKILTHVSGKDEPYKDWGNNVYSFAIPLVQHRPGLPDICIELYYRDDEITREDNYGRRLYLSTEFSARSGRAKNDSLLTYPYPNRLRRSRLSIIESDVFDGSDINVALPKNQFAEYVLDQAEGFDDFDFGAFRRVFDTIAAIITRN